MNSSFIKGMELAEAFYGQAAEPILASHFPRLVYSAALIGSGSEVLGYDDEISSDHQWGPRFLLFLSPEDHERYGTTISNILSENLPHRFLGYSTSFGTLDEGGVRLPEEVEAGPVHHMVHIGSLLSFCRRYLGWDPSEPLHPIDWLTFTEHKLLSVTRGKVFHDGLGQLEPLREQLRYYPHDVWLYLLEAQWMRIGQEQAFMGRCGQVGDDLGSRLVAARLVRDLMRLGFLMEQQYPPYIKWFGAAFKELACAETLAPIFTRVLQADTWQQREAVLSLAYEHVAKMHNDLQVTPPLPAEGSPYYTRPFQIIHAERFAAAIHEAIADEEILKLPRCLGSVDQFIDSTDARNYPKRFKPIYGG